MEGTIVNTMFQGLNEKSIQAVLNSIDVKPFLFGTYFPVKKVIGFSWKTLTNQLAAHNVAADIIATNATTQRKKRPIFESAQGDIPFISISRDMKRSEMQDYQTMLARAGGDTGAIELVDFWANDIKFCFTGVQAELEYLAWQLASNAGELKITNQNNAAIAIEHSLDYQVNEWQKQKVGVSFENKTSASVVDAFKDVVKIAKDNSVYLKYAFTSQDNFYRIANNEEVIKKCASYIQNLTGTPRTPSLADINAMLAQEAYVYGVQLIVIDQTITREFVGGAQKSENPFIDHRIVFSERPILGSTQYDVLDTKAPTILKAQRAHTTVKKYGTIEPESEITIGQADAIPVFDTAYRNVYLKTDGNSW